MSEKADARFGSTEKDKMEISQCFGCKNNDGKATCKAYKEKPKEYQFVSSDKKCPKREGV